jgi:hypothetical protein
MTKFLKKLDLIFCGVDLVFTIDAFMCADWLFGTICGLSTLAFLVLGWKESKSND